MNYVSTRTFSEAMSLWRPLSHTDNSRSFGEVGATGLEPGVTRAPDWTQADPNLDSQPWTLDKLYELWNLTYNMHSRAAAQDEKTALRVLVSSECLTRCGEGRAEGRWANKVPITWWSWFSHQWRLDISIHKLSPTRITLAVLKLQKSSGISFTEA